MKWTCQQCITLSNTKSIVGDDYMTWPKGDIMHDRC